MKKLIFVLITFSISYFSFASEVVVKPELQKVKVFLNGAELTQTVKVKVDAGINEIAVSGIANNIDRNSISVSGIGDGIIISVVQRFDYLREVNQNPEVQKLNSLLEELNIKLNKQQNDDDLLKYDIEFLMANKNIKSEKTGISISELLKMSEFFKKKIAEIKNNMLENNLKIKRTQKEIEKVKKQLEELNNLSNKPTNEIVVTISANKSELFQINISYLLQSAGWSPNYNIYVDDIKSKAKLNYLANVWQNSGFDWNDVPIILSTRNPNKNNTKPELNPWYLNFFNPIQAREIKSNLHKAVAMDETQNLVETKMQTMADYFEINENQLSLEFTPTLNYNIPSDNKPHSISLKDATLNSTYQYYAVPKFDENAFLVMKIDKWDDLNLLPGQANIFFENSFVGKTYLNPQTTKDSMFISLGRDENIIVKRKQLKDFTDEKFLSNDVERNFTYEIQIKNSKKTQLNLIVEEQFPISQQEDIVVKLKDADGAKINNELGSLTWNLKINPNETVTKKFSFSVRYPKDKKIQGL
ncbi:MAG: mucoidy inhibitor MuiA family protein [Stygiobacter sp.]